MNFKLEKQSINNVVSVNDQDIFLQTESGLHLTTQLLQDVQQNVIQKYPLKKFEVMAFKGPPITHEFKNGGKLPDHG
jgi:hypothetical protein